MDIIASAIVTTIITAITIYFTLWGLRLQGKFRFEQLAVVTIVLSLAIVLLGIIFSTSLKHLPDVFSIAANIAVSLFVAYFLARKYLKQEHNLSLRFAIYYTVLGAILGITLGVAFTLLFLSFLPGYFAS